MAMIERVERWSDAEIVDATYHGAVLLGLVNSSAVGTCKDSDHVHCRYQVSLPCQETCLE